MALSTALALVSGCAKVGPDFTSPRTTTSDAWLEADPALIRTDRQWNGEWWGIFGDPALERLVTMGAGQNLPLQVAGLRVYEARARLGIAAGNLYPQDQVAAGELTYERPSARGPSAPQPGTGRSTGDYWASSLYGTASWELDFWGRIRRSIEAAEADLHATMADYDNGLVSLTSEIARTYIAIRTLEERLRIARRNVLTQEEGLRIARARFNYGATGERDVQQALALLRGTQSAIPGLESSLAQSRHAMSVLLGAPPGALPELLTEEGMIPRPPEQVAVGIPADLLRRRPDVRKAEYQAWAQSARIGVAKADLYPAFSLTGLIGFQSSTVGAFGLNDTFSRGFTASGGAIVQWPLFNYGRITNNVRVQDALFQQSLATYENTVLVALREVEDALTVFASSSREAFLLAESAEAAARSVDFAFTQYREGATDFTTVLTAMQDLLTRQDSLAIAQGNISLGVVSTYSALGGGWEIRKGRELVPAPVKNAMEARTGWGGLLDEPPPDPENLPVRGEWRAPDW